MSYIRAQKVSPDGDSESKDIRVYTGGDAEYTLDADLDSEILNFVLGVVEQIENLDEDEALVIWKEIF